MITRLKSPYGLKCTRRVSSSIGALPLTTILPKAKASPVEDNERVSSTSNTTKPGSASSSSLHSASPKSPSEALDDPWASIFEELPISSAATLPAQYFSSRRQQGMSVAKGPAGGTSPGSTFFTPSVFRSGGGKGRRGYATLLGHTRRMSTDTSPWEHIFEGLDRPTSSPLRDGHAAFPARPRKPMTASEISAFDNMFDMIFRATMEKRHSHTATAVAARTAGNVAWSNSESNAAFIPKSSLEKFQSPQFPGVDEQGVFMDGEADKEVDTSPPDMFGQRTHSSRIRRTTEMDELFDRLKESVDLCRTDWEVVQWAGRVLFQEGQPQLATTPSSDSEASSQVRPRADSVTQPQQQLESPSQQQTQPEPQQTAIPPPIYSLLLTHLMYKMRVSYSNPHASLALFTHTKRRSIASYVFGCTTPAYNEFLRARWAIEGLGTAAGDHDGLKGIESVLREMQVNGIGFDSSTRTFVEEVRREVGRTGIGIGIGMEMEREIVRSEQEKDDIHEETAGLDAQGENDGEEETAWDVMTRIEELMASSKRRRRRRVGGFGKNEKEEREGEGKVRAKEGKMEARRKHWDEEWKIEGGKAGLAIGEEDRLTLE